MPGVTFSRTCWRGSSSLVSLDHFGSWGIFRIPSLRTVTDNLGSWDAISSNKTALMICDKAHNRFGRGNLFDWPSKLSLLVKRTSDQGSLSYLLASLYATMLRKNEADPFSAAELGARGGVISQVLWHKKYVLSMTQEFPLMFQQTRVGVMSYPLPGTHPVKLLLSTPLELYYKLDGPKRDPTYVNSMPNDALMKFLKHCLDVSRGFYKPEISGALAKATEGKWTWKQFLECDRVRQRFAEQFKVAYSGLEAKPPCGGGSDNGPDNGPDDAADTGGVSAPSIPSAGAASAPSGPAGLVQFKKDCEAYCDEELESRTVFLTKDGCHEELRNSVTTSRLYANLNNVDKRMMAFYDVKNAKLVETFKGESLIQREPLLDEEDFKSFVTLVNELMKGSCDVCWILCGKGEENYEKIQRQLRIMGWKTEGVLPHLRCEDAPEVLLETHARSG